MNFSQCSFALTIIYFINAGPARRLPARMARWIINSAAHLAGDAFIFHIFLCDICLTLCKEALEIPLPASPIRSSKMSIRPSLLMSSSLNSSAQRFSLSLLSWQHAEGSHILWGPITGATKLTGSRCIKSVVTTWHKTVLTSTKASYTQWICVVYLGLLRPVVQPTSGLKMMLRSHKEEQEQENKNPFLCFLSLLCELLLVEGSIMCSGELATKGLLTGHKQNMIRTDFKYVRDHVSKGYTGFTVLYNLPVILGASNA